MTLFDEIAELLDLVGARECAHELADIICPDTALPVEDWCERLKARYPRPRYGATPCSGSHTPSGGAPVCQNTSIGMPPRGYQ